MSKDIKVRIMSGISALILSTSTISLSTIGVYAEGVNTKETKNQKNDIVNYYESQYNRYIIAKNDNYPIISRKICNYFGKEPTTKYWLVLAYLNGFSRNLEPGETIIYPSTFEDMDSLWFDLKDNIGIEEQINEERKSKRKIVTVRDLIIDIYGEENVNNTFISKYLGILGLSDKYTANTIIKENYNAIFELSDWIPTYEEVTNFNLGLIKTRNK